ncbi:hypothetical protein DESPIG_00471 [Desulfovibrio piger ATCC 29098]|uniref:Uncharacterized protein n=1 Tax=Desulfovibrio piger ATCC 29098 TaxID=411464 RepID=B6WQZ1_9BACT|nr:hypothetical protein DESPIG_00471 [Desulfovibrio piger ATCC 29098]
MLDRKGAAADGPAMLVRKGRLAYFLFMEIYPVIKRMKFLILRG